ncbi:hypothetical protein HY229_01755 [Candidatus Acetothermia bacterium]|nr:hypothetical protein [Candidatus Acetothermia bacterium]MBI3642815.1 hypothetical protein [Candidatus Acetothermia bacterium]
MSTKVADELKKVVLKSLEETFENVHGIYLDKGTSLLETLESISAEEASKPVSPKCTSIAAHAEHARFYLHVLGDYIEEKTIAKIDWETTWLKTKVTPSEWKALKGQLKEGYQRISALINGFDTWEGEHEIGGAIAILMHTAYHIGAIRAMLCVVR